MSASKVNKIMEDLVTNEGIWPSSLRGNEKPQIDVNHNCNTVRVWYNHFGILEAEYLNNYCRGNDHLWVIQSHLTDAGKICVDVF